MERFLSRSSKGIAFFLINQAICKALKALPPVRAELENSIQVAWEKTQEKVRAETDRVAEAGKKGST